MAQIDSLLQWQRSNARRMFTWLPAIPSSFANSDSLKKMNSPELTAEDGKGSHLRNSDVPINASGSNRIFSSISAMR